MKKLIVLGLFTAISYAGGSGGLLPGNGWCGTQQQPIGSYCQSTAAVVDIAKKQSPEWLNAPLFIFNHIIVTPDDSKKAIK